MKPQRVRSAASRESGDALAREFGRLWIPGSNFGHAALAARWWFCSALIASLLVSAIVHAQPSNDGSEDSDTRARELFIEGDRAYAEGDYETALVAFEQAYALSRRHALLYNMANAHERLGEYDQALEKLRQFLPHASSSQQSLIEKRMQSLQIRLDGQRASTQLSGKPLGEEGEEPETVVEQSDGSIPAGASPPYLGYGLVGVGALGLGLGTYFGFQALGARSEAQDGCPDVGGVRRCSTLARDAVDRDRSYSLMADVGVGVGLVSAAVGVWLILTHEPGPQEKGERGGVVAMPRPGGGEVEWMIRF